MERYRVYYSMRGCVMIEANSEAEAEQGGYEYLRAKKIPNDDTEIHCAELEDSGGYNG